MCICCNGAHIICMRIRSKKWGFYDLCRSGLLQRGELDAAFQENTKAVFGEAIAMVVLDIEKFAQAAHAHGVPLIIDNTFATPINCRPFEWGGRHRNSFYHEIYGRTCHLRRRGYCGQRKL